MYGVVQVPVPSPTNATINLDLGSHSQPKKAFYKNKNEQTMSVPKSLAGQHVNVAMMTSGGRIFVAVSDVCCVVPSHTISHTIRKAPVTQAPDRRLS